ncbi:hypothetical protein OPKNFCMD_4692 [Methylobacterium crusticola]|uniref:DUF1127 domain-containing protein n=1 Tax=Methylobacterium crusticola TaxID=1697972 RepID=A0ABQ4R2Z6_9HYPH|nr:hypothetical protein [Methylobacterium crusticola]GJD51933.1 hypothetical protein OPKNFCMD_4692 [Methylobacterium crusticola]
MPQAETLLPRPALTSPTLLAATVDSLGRRAASRQDLWRLLTETYTVDLDAVAAVLPREEPEPVWLPARR